MFNVHFSLFRDSSEINTGEEDFFGGEGGGDTFRHSSQGASSFSKSSGGGRFNQIGTNYKKNIGSVGIRTEGVGHRDTWSGAWRHT